MPTQFIEIEFQFDRKKKLRSLIRKIADMLLYDVTIGIHPGEGRRKVEGKNKKINIADLSEILEQGATCRTSTGGTFIIPSRIFIKLPKLPTVWAKIVNRINSLFKSFILSKSYITNGKSFWNKVGLEVELNQKERINNGHYPPLNTPLTVQWKGFNHPLLNRGNLLNSIKFKVNKNYNSGAKKLTKLKYIEDFEKQAGIFRKKK